MNRVINNLCKSSLVARPFPDPPPGKRILSLGPPPRPGFGLTGWPWVPFMVSASATAGSWIILESFKEVPASLQEVSKCSLGFTVRIPEIYKNLQKRLDRF